MATATIQKLDKGNPIEELVRGSKDYTMYQIRRDFYRQHPDTMDEYYWVEEIFDEYVIVNSDSLPLAQYYRVDYEQADGRFVFSERDEWEIVELAYQPTGLTERLRKNSGKKITETFTDGVRIAEAQDGKPRTILGDGATADVINGNGRRYRESVLIEAVADARHHLQQSLSQGRAILLGEEEHPRRANLTKTIVVWEDIHYDRRSKQIKLDGRMVENSRGKDAIITMDAGVLPGISLRGYGESEFIEEDGRTIEEVLWLRLTGFDLVMDPSFSDAGVRAIESLNGDDNNMSTKTDTQVKGKGKDEGVDVDVADVLTESNGKLSAGAILSDHPEIADQIVKHVRTQERMVAEEALAEERKLREAAEALNKEAQVELRKTLNIDDEGDIIAAVREAHEARAKLEAAENARQVQTYITEHVAKLNSYPAFIRESLQAAVEKAEPKTVEEAKGVVAAQREIFDKMVAEWRLQQKGHSITFGDSLEEETGYPEFAFAAFEITEGLRKAGHGKRIDWRNKESLLPSEVFTLKMLERMDELHRSKLLAEAKQIREAETTTDLNLPYSVTRAIMEQAYPDLIAANVFDFGVMTNSPDRIYYESQFAGESGYSADVTGDENVNAAVVDTWYDLPSGHKRIDFDSISMQPAGGGTPYVFGVDYVIDFVEGKYMVLDGGSMAAATAYDFDYTYNAVRKGENTEIERAKAQLAYTTLEAFADRLALQVTKEAVIFSRSQVGWDAAMNSINLLIKELRLLIEKNLLHLGLSRAATVANNIAGTWDSSSDTAQELVQLILGAKTKVENRNYAVNSVIMSKTRGDSLILWDGFTAAGERSGFRLQNAFGLLGYIAETPVFTSTVFPDSFVLVNHKELVQHRVFQPMVLEGPFPVYGANQKLVGSKEYYVEEFNGTVTPIAEKGSLVRIS